MWMAGMLFLSSCSVKEDRSGCPCWMTVDLSDVAECRWKSPEVQSGAEYQGITKSPESRSNVAENILLRLRGNSDEDAVDYEYQRTETVRTDVGTLEYEGPRGAVGVSAVALEGDFSTSLRSARNDNKEIPDQVGYDGERAEDDGERVIVDRLPLGEYIARSGYDWAAEDLADVSVALDLEKQQVMITVSDWDGVVVMDIVI